MEQNAFGPGHGGPPGQATHRRLLSRPRVGNDAGVMAGGMAMAGNLDQNRERPATRNNADLERVSRRRQLLEAHIEALRANPAYKGGNLVVGPVPAPEVAAYFGRDPEGRASAKRRRARGRAWARSVGLAPYYFYDHMDGPFPENGQDTFQERSRSRSKGRQGSPRLR